MKSLGLLEAARRIASSTESYENRVVALNLLYEDRAVLACEQDIEALFLQEGGTDVKRLSAALETYLTQWVRREPNRTFLRPENDDNAVSVGPDDLLHVWNVEAFLTNLDEDNVAAASFLDRNGLTPMSADVRQWLARLEKEFVRQDFGKLGALLDFRNEYRTACPRHPTWAVRWKHAAELIDLDDPNTWLRAVGLSTSESYLRYLALLRYPAERARSSSRRPTQIRGGLVCFALSFPAFASCRPFGPR